jgi:hypothetical protein
MCPSCHSNDVSRSRKRKLKDRLMRWMGKVAYRCRDCHRRFYVTLDVDKRLRGLHEWQKKTQEHAASAAANGGTKKGVRSNAEDPLNDYGEDFEL